MINIIKKEVMISKIYGIVASVYALMFSFIIYNVSDQLLARTVFLSYILFISIVIHNLIIQAEIKNNIDVFMTSLPIKRSNSVIVKYIINGLYPLLVSIIVYLFIILYKFFDTKNFLTTYKNLISIEFIFLATSLTLIYLAICFPLYYYSTGKANILNYIFFIIALFIPGLLSAFSSNLINSRIIQFIFGVSFRPISLIALSISLIIYLASLQFSIAIYDKKEF